ncbi:MAG: CocE/NonD family hydrolase [Cyclobacteriaceae bacterium]|nr:CocE/NonD family hydrolase [Cyclobacteriaceae bacterium]
MQRYSFLIAIIILLTFGCREQHTSSEKELADSLYVKIHYQKKEVSIAMRDGIKLHTSIFTPKDKTENYPIMLMRTCYGVKPYGEDQMPKSLGPSGYFLKDKFIFVYQDVRGRWMSEGAFDNMRPHVPDKNNPRQIDESSDTFDTIEWLLANVENHNGKVGQWGISYPGFYTIAAAIDAHPALVASSPQAPIADFYFDDFHHHGAYLQSYWMITPLFGTQKNEPVNEPWYEFVKPGTPDGYQFHMNLGPLKNSQKYYKDNFFWQQIIGHPNYDEFWQERSVLPHLNNIQHAILTVGGWFDAEDLFGPLNIYKSIENQQRNHFNQIVMGPWGHGDWARKSIPQYVGNIYYGDSIADFYQKEIEFPFFSHFLKEKPLPELPEAYMFDTGLKKWFRFNEWPPEEAEVITLYPDRHEKLSFKEPKNADVNTFSYVSDPLKPVPSTEDIKKISLHRKFMTSDQRHAYKRPDVLSFQTEPLSMSKTVAGEIVAYLDVSTTAGDADWIVKIIDVYPPDHPSFPDTPSHITMGEYQQLVRSEVIRGRFRNSYRKPEPFVAGQKTRIVLPIQDVLHTFKEGHKIMIQIQSTWFPYIDRNPQQYVENIFDASEEDFIKATHTIYGSSFIQMGGKSGISGLDIISK